MSGVDADEWAIRTLVDRWAVYRDNGDWDRLERLWHPRGRMVATWFSGPALDFIERSRTSFGSGAMAHHVLGGTAVDVSGRHAVATTRMTLHLRTTVDAVLCDIECLGQFVDFLIKEGQNWVIALRQPVYEKDHLSPVDPSATLRLDQALLSGFPDGYRHLAYAQARLGMEVRRDLPGTSGPEREALERLKVDWLSGRTETLLGAAATQPEEIA